MLGEGGASSGEWVVEGLGVSVGWGCVGTQWKQMGYTRGEECKVVCVGDSEKNAGKRANVSIL
jgi:hypothetical protein